MTAEIISEQAQSFSESEVMQLILNRRMSFKSDLSIVQAANSRLSETSRQIGRQGSLVHFTFTVHYLYATC